MPDFGRFPATICNHALVNPIADASLGIAQVFEFRQIPRNKMVADCPGGWTVEGPKKTT
jgi:hypothetical protein